MTAGVLLRLTGCASAAEPRTGSSASLQDAPAFRAAPCNLGARSDGALARATYTAPAIDPCLFAEYGPTVASDSCSDADIIRWQEHRRERGDIDRIRRIVYYNDDLMATVYPIGCAVPVVVIADAPR
ncbi:hypothetical protein [Microbacterium paulum]